MRLGVLFSGGKDSCLAMQKAKRHGEIACLITLKSKNPESFMFHTPTIDMTQLQAQALELPLLVVETAGEKEEELIDLKNAMEKAKDQYGINGIVTGAIESVYQASRIERVCAALKLWCFNPLWKRDQLEHLQELNNLNYDVVITSVSAFPLDVSFLGRSIDNEMISRLERLNKIYSISPSGEGGEIETLVVDCPMFRRRIKIEESNTNWDGSSGIMNVMKAKLEDK